MRLVFYISIILFSASLNAQNFWGVLNQTPKDISLSKTDLPNDSKLFTLNQDAMLSYLKDVPSLNEGKSSTTTLEFPTTDGGFKTFYIYENSNFVESLQRRYPEIRSYKGVSVDDASETISFSISQLGVKTMHFKASGQTELMGLVDTDDNIYSVYDYKLNSGKEEFICHTEDTPINVDEITDSNRNADDKKLRTARIAISVNGEYSAYFGGTIANSLAAMNATLTRVNGVFEKEMAIHFNLIDNTDIIFLNKNTDPYTSSSYWSQQLQNTLNQKVGAANYDIGHLFAANGGGGYAGCIGCICSDYNKGSGYTSSYAPKNDSFDIDFVAHEIGHQVGANHTFSRSEGTGVNFEPGSGSTIMGYAGITGNYDVQAHSDPYFHYASIYQVTANIKNKACLVKTDTNNNPPTADAGADYTIPAGTPFVLTGVGSDPDGDEITYSWEQIDNSSSSSYTLPNANATTGPLFRSYTPTTSPKRYIPKFENVLKGNFNSKFEVLPMKSRVMKFALVVRDNHAGGGQNASDQMRVLVNANNGVFKVTKPELNKSFYGPNGIEVKWDVANTNSNPFNVPKVDIYLSLDAGATFELAAAQVDNNGSYNLVVDKEKISKNAIVKVKASNNIFYSISKPFLIGYKLVKECKPYNFTGLNKNIPDASSNGPGSYVIGEFNAPNLGEILEARVHLNVTHPNMGDLRMILQTPSPIKLMKLWTNKCNNTANFNSTFSQDGANVDCSNIGEFIKPEDSFNTLIGRQTQGRWVVGIRDAVQGQTGKVNSGYIEFCNHTHELLSTNEIEVSKDVDVYPNPSKGVFNVNLDSSFNDAQLKVYNVTGQLVYSKSVNNSRSSVVLDLSHLQKGVYYLNITSDNAKANKELIIN